MCGIAGFNWADRGLMSKMLAKIKHRGPDDSGMHVDSGVSMGHQRLSIMDLSPNGHQPMYNETRRVVVVFNGEIWNYRVLRLDLEEKGHKFSSESDTEVIVHGYEEWGLKVFGMLEGMFAIAIWDRKQEKLILARDGIGKKPLYYHYKKGKLRFASEIKAILEDSEVERKVNMQCLSNFLTLRYSQGNETMFSGISKVDPGSFLVFHKGKLTKKRYWEIPKFNGENKEDLKNTDRLISFSVRKRLMSDVPIGVFLSGGLDSSAIVAYMSKYTEKIKTFSVGFDGPTDETKYAKIIADRFNTEHMEIRLDENILDNLPEIVWHFDEPFADPAAVPTYLLCKEVSKHVKVALSGEGGDELFGGYDTYNSIEMIERIRRIPKSLRSGILAKIALQTAKIFGYPRKQMFKLASEIFESDDEVENFKRLFYLPFTPADKKRLFDKSKSLELKSAFDKIFEETQDLEKAALRYYFEEWLPNDVLMKADKMSMAHGLEVRTPFLDKDLMNYFAGLPYKNKKNRDLFRKTISERLPKEIMEKKKQGFTLPLASWVKKKEVLDKIKPHLEDLGRRGIFKEGEYKKILENPEGFRNDHRLWVLLNFEIWYKIYMENAKPGDIKF